MQPDAGVLQDSGGADAGLEDDELRMCQQRSTDGCELDGLCAIVGAQRYDAQGDCYGEFEPVVCLSPASTFNGTVSCPTAPDGTRWRFPEGTTLFGWSNDNDEACASVPSCG